jgi:hypothetical protein
MHTVPTISLRSWWFSLAALLWVSVMPQTSTARTAEDQDFSTQAMSASEYKEKLDQCSNALKNPDQIGKLRASLPHAWIVQTSQGRIEVPTAWLSTELYKVQNDPKEAKAASTAIDYRLTIMRREADDWEGVSLAQDSGQARAKLDKILKRSEFSGAQGPNPLQLFLAKLERRILEWILRLLSHVNFGRATGNVLTWLVAGLAILALGWWAYGSIVNARRNTVAVAQTSGVSAESRAWAADALAAAERGDYREAMHCAYWAAIVRLEGLGLLKEDRARTPRESLRLLAKHPDEQQSLINLTQHFELIWYGYRPASAQDWSAARALLEKMGCLTALTEATASS